METSGHASHKDRLEANAHRNLLDSGELDSSGSEHQYSTLERSFIMKYHPAVALALCASLTFPSMAEDYGSLMARKVKDALGKNAVKGYVFSSYPLDNFGVGTAYSYKDKPENFICATWECVGIADDTKVSALSADDKLRVMANGVQYVTPGTGPSLNLTEDEKKSIGLNLLLPKLLQVLDITADLSHTDDINTTLTLGPLSVRLLRKDAMLTMMKSPNGNSAEKAAADAGNLVLVYSDIVASSMKVEIKPNPETKADLDAKLSAALTGKVGTVIGQNSDLSFKLDNSSKGDYSFTIDKPVIVAVYVKKQPKGGVLGDQAGWNDWKNVDLGTVNKVVSAPVDLKTSK